jgi:hypothetical protein
VKTPDPTRK